MSMSYEDGEKYCEAVDLTVDLRCDIRGLITCRGPENTKKYWKKCASKADGQCAMALMAEKMRTGRIAGFQEKKERLVDFIKKDTKLTMPTGVLNGVCMITSKHVSISVYATGVTECSVDGCELSTHRRCTKIRLYEATKQVIAAKVRLGKEKLAPEEFQEAIDLAKVIVDGLVKTDNP